MEAIYRLAWLREDAGLVPVNWRDMETEELGSVYESLLELTPRLSDDGRGFAFAEGGETQGPCAQDHRQLLHAGQPRSGAARQRARSCARPGRGRGRRSRRGAAKRHASSIPPAVPAIFCSRPRGASPRGLRGSARGGVAAAADFRHALRDVARACIHGVDRNPMAVELTKVALWIETVEPGKPLGFLDANIRCGDALLGVFDLEVLGKGIPDAAYKPLTGDDKETAKLLRGAQPRRKDEDRARSISRGGTTSWLPPPPPMADASRLLRALPEDSARGDRRKATPHSRGGDRSGPLALAGRGGPLCRRVPRAEGRWRARQPQHGDDTDDGPRLGGAFRAAGLRPADRARAGPRGRGARVSLAARVP